MDGSHLCHHATCINQHYLNYEDAGINMSQIRCSRAAQDMQMLLDVEIPKHCARHDPPCLLHVRALIDASGWETDLSLACCFD